MEAGEILLNDGCDINKKNYQLGGNIYDSIIMDRCFRDASTAIEHR